MLKKNRSLYSALLSGMTLVELDSLYSRSDEYVAIRIAIEIEIDQRLTGRDETSAIGMRLTSDTSITRLVAAG
jgi:hypothetical protein